MELGSVIKVNPEQARRDYPYEEIEYIDISSVGSGILHETKRIEFVNAPSRAKRIIRNGDTVLATVRPNLRAFWFAQNIKENTIVSTGFAVLRANEEADPRFIYYTVTNQLFTDYLTANAKGAAYPAVDTETIERADVYLPPLPIQRKIASILSTYDDLIENNLRRIKILEEMAQNLYREWFVNFRFPGHEHARFVDSPLGNIPEGWEPIPIKDFLTKNIGGSWGKEEISGDYQSKVRVIRGTDFSRIKVGTFDTIPTRYIKQKELNNRMLEAGDLLIENSVNASSRCVGTPQIITQGILKRLEDPTICASFCKLYRPKTDKHTALFYLHMKYLLEESKMNFYQNVAANGIGNFQSQRFLQDEMIIVPSEFAELDKLLCIVKPLLTSIYAEKIDILRQTRDLLLPKLISGEVDVSELDIKVPEEAVS